MFERNYIHNPPRERKFSIEKSVHDYYPQIVTEPVEPIKEIKFDEEKKEKRDSRRAIKKGSKRHNQL